MSNLKIYNTLTKQKELFKPLDPAGKKVGLYVCGITVYDYCHVGHARVYLMFDIVIRYLKHLGYEVKYIRNITDIDDKIIQRAAEQLTPGEAIEDRVKAITERFIKAMHEDFKGLGLGDATVEPRATEYVASMVTLIQTLLDKDCAYIGSNGDLFFNVKNYKHYGELSHRNLEDLLAGARVEVNEAKRNPLDFVLWKMSKPGEPFWPSPWGNGRPGWHTECCVMSFENLGETIDIHGGGPDLKFPHHENERAQSESVTGKRFVNLWMHVGFLQIEKEKMSKSLGNFITVKDFLNNHSAEVLRFFVLSSHYRSPVDYGEDHLVHATQGLSRLYTALRGLPLAKNDMQSSLSDFSNFSELATFETRFHEAMQDDFNTPLALSVMFDIAREINRERDSNPDKAIALGKLLLRLSGILGILQEDPDHYLQHADTKGLTEQERQEIDSLIEQRNAARNSKNWAESDRIRDKLLAQGVVLEDTPKGTLWRKQ